MDSETQTLLLVAGAAALYLSYKGLFKPSGIESPQALSNTVTRTGGISFRPTIIKEEATYINTGGDTTYKIRDSELDQTGFIRRRASAVAFLPSFMQTTAIQNWVYS